MMKYIEEITKALKSSISTKRRAIFTLSSATLIFILMVLGARLTYSMQMLSYSINLFPRAVKDLFLYNSNNAIRILTVAYALLGGSTLTVTGLKLKNGSFGVGSLGIAPGFLASGCAGCGVGIVGIIGLSGGLALLPFHGAEILILGIGFLLVYLYRTGNPETCSIDVS